LLVTAAAQAGIHGTLVDRAPRFVAEAITRVRFDPNYSTEDDTVLWIEDFRLPAHIEEAMVAPLEVPHFDPTRELGKVKALFHVDVDGNVFFQCWRNVVTLTTKLWFLLHGDTFDVEGRPPLVIDRKVDAVFHEGNLLFVSYGNTAAMIDLLEYVSEATNDDIAGFVSHPLLRGNAEEIVAACSKSHRKQIRQLVQSGALSNNSVNIADLESKAREVDCDIEIQDGRLVIPCGGRSLTDLLRFLTDRYYRGPVSGRTYYANSARQRAR